MNDNELRDTVRAKYGQAALNVMDKKGAGCCGKGSASTCCSDPITSDLYDQVQVGELPEAAVLASLGCGNPTALAELKAGETVLDLGSGGGDCVFVSVKWVRPAGFGYRLRTTSDKLFVFEKEQTVL